MNMMSKTALEIRFKFDLNKALAAMAYIINRLGPTDKVKLMKLLYIADRESFLRLGYPIIGDRPFAMKFGPVPSNCLDVVDGDRWPDERELIFHILSVDNYRVSLTGESPVDLDGGEKAVLDEVMDRYGAMPPFDLVNVTHGFPEYREAYVEYTSKPISYESILRLCGDERHFRMNRPVISTEMAAHMECPFPGDDSDL